jgi:hypothetical protein
MNIVEMRAGPKLDALIAGKVMGWRNATGPWIGGITPWATDTGYRRKAEFCPSTDIAVAWEVVDSLQGGLCFELRRQPDGRFCCWFGEEMSAEASTAALAICRAALRV